VDLESTAEPAIGIDPAPITGWFDFYFADERWEWSPEVAEIHGYQPGSVTPSTDLVMRHKHPDDLPKMAASPSTSSTTPAQKSVSMASMST